MYFRAFVLNFRTFFQNPMFIVNIHEPDGDNESNLCTVIISLMQKGRRALFDEGLGFLKIGFEVYHVPNRASLKPCLDQTFFKNNFPEKCYSNCKDFDDKIKEVVGRFTLHPGTYCIVPSSFHPGEKGEFFLRVFTENPVIFTENY